MCNGLISLMYEFQDTFWRESLDSVLMKMQHVVGDILFDEAAENSLIAGKICIHYLNSVSSFCEQNETVKKCS